MTRVRFFTLFLLLLIVVGVSAASASSYQLLWQIGTPDGAVNPIDGSAEYPATGAFVGEFDYVVGDDSDSINSPNMPGYIGNDNVCAFVSDGRPCTDTTAKLNIHFDLSCTYQEASEALMLYYDRYGSESDQLYFLLDDDPFATVSATEGGFRQFAFDLTSQGQVEPGSHKLTIEYAGGGDGNGHYIDYLKLEATESDCQGPLTSNVVTAPNPVAVGSTVDLSAVVDDTTTGNSVIASAEYQVNGEPWTQMLADDGFDSPTEGVYESFNAPDTADIYNLCVRGTDIYGNVGPEECTMLVVFDPEGGFVTGGGWITSPEGAMPPTLTDVMISGVSGDTSIDPGAAYAPYYLRYVGNPPPAGYDPDHNYQWGTPAILTPSPEDGPVTMVGTIDVDDQTVGQVAMIGLLDRDDLAAGNSSFQRGAYIYIYRSSATSWRIGPTDGNAGGEIVQTFVTIADTDLPADGILDVALTVDGTADGTTCAVGPYTAPAGCMTLQIAGGSVNATLTDSYGDVVGANSSSPEFANGAVPGWDDYLGSYVGYTLTVPSLVSGSPQGRANFGFVSKYKKGASTPTGNTEFQFQAGDLNFHSTSYDWLVVTGSDFAKFKGEGTINGEGSYKFMLWAGDNDPDTFRIKIWTEEDGTESIIYDNGFDQAIGGGNIVVHTPKK